MLPIVPEEKPLPKDKYFSVFCATFLRFLPRDHAKNWEVICQERDVSKAASWLNAGAGSQVIKIKIIQNTHKRNFTFI